MKTVKKLLCLMLVAMLLVSAVPTAFANGNVDFWIELWVDGAHVDSQRVPDGIAVGTNMDEAAIKAAAKNIVEYAAYFGAGYTYDGVEDAKTVTEANQGAKIKFITTPGCAHEEKMVAEQAPTCSKDGVKIIRCGSCGERLSTETLPATGEHNYVDGVCACGAEEPAQVKKLIVTIFESVDGQAAKQVGEKEIDKNAYSSEEAMVKALYTKGYKEYRFRDFGDGTAQLVVYAMETKDDDVVFQLKVIHNDSTSNYTLIDIYEGEGILAAISNAGVANKLKKQGKVIDDIEYVLVGFSINHTGNSKTSLNIHHTATADLADSNGYIKVYADWEKKTDDNTPGYEFPDDNGGLYGDENEDPIYDAVLYIYTNGKTGSYAKKVASSEMGKYTKDGKLTRGEVELIVQKYFKVGAGATYNGLFNTETWNKGNYLNMNAKYEMDLNPDKTTAVYVMVNPATLYVADSSNPKTGDMITIAVTGMALSAAAMVALIETKKRKMI